MMDWLPSVLDFLFLAGQVSACLGLAYGGYICLRYSHLPSARGEKAALGANRRQSKPGLPEKQRLPFFELQVFEK